MVPVMATLEVCAVTQPGSGPWSVPRVRGTSFGCRGTGVSLTAGRADRASPGKPPREKTTLRGVVEVCRGQQAFGRDRGAA